MGPENVFLTNGSDDIINFAFMAFNDPGTEIAMPEISYSFYNVIAKLHAIKPLIIPLKDDMTIDPADYIGIGKNIVIPNPNAPTGLELGLDAIEAIVKSNPDNVVLIDEAYVDFGGTSSVPLTKKYDNLLVSQTFSKSRSFAGGRLGFAIADKGLIADLGKMQFSTNPYNVNNLTLILAEAAIDADEYYQANCRRIEAIREEAIRQLTARGFDVLPSKTNFVFAKHRTISGDDIYKGLKARGVLVRHFSDPKITDYCRITIGNEAQMQTLYDKLDELMSQA